MRYIKKGMIPTLCSLLLAITSAMTSDFDFFLAGCKNVVIEQICIQDIPEIAHLVVFLLFIIAESTEVRFLYHITVNLAYGM